MPSKTARLELPGRPRPYVMAHRGNRAACPENTLAAFRRALQDGADLLETDLHLSLDGAFVCIHDATLDRTTDGRGPVADRSLAELKALIAGAGRPGFEHERIPTLAELAAILPPDRALALELKSDRFLEPEVGRRLAAELGALGVRARTILLSFRRERLRAVRAAAPDLAAGHITMADPLPLGEAGLLGPFWPLLVLNPLYVGWAHARGRLVCPLDPAPEPRLWLYRLLGCDAVLSDDPAKTLAALGRR